jgi:hypothetical protein
MSRFIANAKWHYSKPDGQQLSQKPLQLLYFNPEDQEFSQPSHGYIQIHNVKSYLKRRSNPDGQELSQMSLFCYNQVKNVESYLK